MSRKPWGRIDLTEKANAQELLGAVQNLLESPGWQLLSDYLKRETNKLRMEAGSRTIVHDASAQLINHNMNVMRADAYEDILALVPEIVKQCRAKIEGERNA